MPFEFERHSEIPDLITIQPRVFPDDRGWFQETYQRGDFEAAGIPGDFRQDNHSRSTVRGVIRGLHYQVPPMAQGKLVRCVTGTVLDVAVDIRAGSPTYGKCVGVELSAENHRIFWVPEGFAHGYCTLTEISEVLYKTTAEYSAAHDRGIRWNDPALGIRWPVADPSLSAKDAKAPLLSEAQNPFVWSGRP
jgi:dTDP-4-dehydrorhamnose 3,5-epimerase